MLPWWDIPLLIGLGLFAGGLAGLLGIGGGLIFAPLLLWLNLPPSGPGDQQLRHCPHGPGRLGGAPAKRCSARAIRRCDRRRRLRIGPLFGGLAGVVSGWVLLAMQTLMYVVLAFVVRDRSSADEPAEATDDQAWGWLAGVGCIAGWTAGMLGLGGGLVMVPLMSGPLGLPIHRSVRLSTVAVFCSATAASLQFLHESRGVPWMGLVLGVLLLWRPSGPRRGWINSTPRCSCDCSGDLPSCWHSTAVAELCIS